MKKVFFYPTFMFLFLSGFANAQTDAVDSRDKLTAGLKAGFNYSNVWDEKGDDFRADPLVGFAGGGFVSIPIGKYLGFQPELLLSQKGFKGEGTLLLSKYTLTRRTTFIDVPLLLQFKPIEYVSLFLGPQYSYLLRETNTYTYGPNSTEQQNEFENSNVRKNILGFVFGADINIKHFVLSGRYCYDLQTNNGDGSSNIPRYKNRWLQFTVGVRI